MSSDDIGDFIITLKADAQAVLAMVKDHDLTLSRARELHTEISEIIGWLEGVKQQIEVG